MTDVQEIQKGKESEIYEEFPYPKLVKLFDFYFPKTKGHEKIDWRRILRIWARWAPWITVVLLILICCFMTNKNFVGGVAVFAFIASFLNFIYYLALALFAKVVKRSPLVLLALTPKVPFMCLIPLTIFYLIFLNDPKKANLEREKAAYEEKVRKSEENWEELKRISERHFPNRAKKLSSAPTQELKP